MTRAPRNNDRSGRGERGRRKSFNVALERLQIHPSRHHEREARELNMPPFKDEHLMIICPGTHTTLAQLGLPESYTPASTRLRTRMFPAPDGQTWEPHKIRAIKKDKPAAPELGAVPVENGENKKEDEDEFEEDLDSDEGAVYPLTEGKITNMPAFLALLNHVHNLLSPTLHTPILLIAQAAWTAQDQESLTQFFFEKFKTPAFCIMDSALAITYGFGLEHGTVIDVGYQKVDVTAVVDFSVHHVGRTIALPKVGGEAMTEQLLKLLGPKGWTKDMCESLKKSSFCEILPSGTPLPGTDDVAKEISNPAAAASTGASASGPGVKISEVPRGPGPDTEVGEEDDNDGKVDDEGVLDVASIVTSGKTQEFLAAQEKKKAAAAQRKATRDAREAAEAAAAKPIRLPNSKREKVTFVYQERKTVEESEKAGTEVKPIDIKPVETLPQADVATESTAMTNTGTAADGEVAPDASVPVDDQGASKEQAKATKREERRKARGDQDPAVFRREIEVGTERFLSASGGILDSVADAVHRTVLSVVDISIRSNLWENIIIVGNGSKVRGYKEALLNTLSARYLISPSSATIFTSELPSNLSTPMGTGSQTPTKEYPAGQYALPTGSHVNPLLLAATTAGNPAMQNSVANSVAGGQFGGGHHSSHSQSPTSIKVAKVPDYFPEFKAHGTEEFVFLGAQIAAKAIFIQDAGASGFFMSRVQYNDMGPSGIHEVGLCF